MKIEKIVCKRCKLDLAEDYSIYLAIKEASQLMDAHDKVVHGNEYEVTYKK